MTDENSITLGGNIELSGFSNLDGGQIIVLKKIIGNYVNRIGTITSNFEKLNMTMKSVHGNQFELHLTPVTLPIRLVQPDSFG